MRKVEKEEDTLEKSLPPSSGPWLSTCASSISLFPPSHFLSSPLHTHPLFFFRGKKSPLTGEDLLVVAAGGIYDGRGLAMALSFGCQGFFFILSFHFSILFSTFPLSSQPLTLSPQKQNKTKQNKTKQNKTKQNKTKQNKTKQNKK